MSALQEPTTLDNVLRHYCAQAYLQQPRGGPIDLPNTGYAYPHQVLLHPSEFSSYLVSVDAVSFIISLAPRLAQCKLKLPNKQHPGKCEAKN